MLLKTTTVDKTSTSHNDESLDELVSLYTDPPTEEITLDEFELYALDRLQLLRGIETLKAKGFEGKDLNSRIETLEKTYMPLKSNGSTIERDENGRTQNQRKDQISHYILRLAYCRTEDLRRWFLQQESALLNYRVENMPPGVKPIFMGKHGLAKDKLSTQEKEEMREKLLGLGRVNEGQYITTEFYRVPFQQALSLVSKRAVFLDKGDAIVPLDKLESTLVNRFRIHLSRALMEAAQLFDHVSGDTRIAPLLKNMNKQYVGKDFSKSAGGSLGKLTLDVVDEAAERNMPLCMKNLHDNLKKDHKLKHWGRLQYGLFLKGAGMEMEDALMFWENHFTKLISHDNFQKQYAYSFRHMYGKEGARKNYTPYSCMKIIMGTPPEPGAFHGCPYRHSTENQLTAQLNALKLSGPDVSDIMKLAKTNNYQLACQKHFDVTHPGHLTMDLGAHEGGAVSNHPNLWYQTSVTYHKAKSGKGKAAVNEKKESVPDKDRKEVDHGVHSGESMDVVE